MDTDTTYPSRVVDRENQGWRSMGADRYVADMRHDLDELPYPELESQRGPLRPVEPVADADQARLVEAFDLAGKKTVTTLAAALETVYHQHRQQKGGLKSPWESAAYAERSMIAGRAGSWESQALIRVILVGNSFNLIKPSQDLPEQDVQARRRAGPGKRVHPEAHAMLVKVFQHWTSNPARYTEVAETLASVLGEYADAKHGDDGWRQIADQWIRPESLARDDFHHCYHLFYSRSEHCNPDLL